MRSILLAVAFCFSCSSASSDRAAQAADTATADVGGADSFIAPEADVVLDDGSAVTPDSVEIDTTATPDTAPRDPELAIERTLFVGNSFTFGNDLERLWASLREAGGTTVDSRRVASAGYRLDQHLADATGSASTAPLRELLVTAPPAWDVVVLQEQSQIPGFPAGQPEHDASVAAAVALAGFAKAAGALTIVFDTWGYRTGDPSNPDLFGDYLAMQDALDSGFAEMAAAVAASGAPVRRLRAGAAFRTVYLDLQKAGQDPLAADTLFSRLYANDGRHPSLLGSYLTACVLAASLAEDGRIGSEFVPEGIPATDATVLRETAERVANQ